MKFFKKFTASILCATLFIPNVHAAKFDITTKLNPATSKNKLLKTYKAIGGGSIILISAGIIILIVKNTHKPSSHTDYISLIKKLPKNLKWKMVIDNQFHNTAKGCMICDEGGKAPNGTPRSTREHIDLFTIRLHHLSASSN